MENLIFYKYGKNLKPVVEQVSFSYQRRYQTLFAATPEQLKSILQNQRQGLLFFFSESLSQAERIMIRNIVQSLEKVKLCLCSKPDFALDAWNLNVFHFLAFPVKSDGLLKTYRKYLENAFQSDNTLSLNTKEGLVKLDFNSICFVKAAGNYSTIQMADGKSFVQTKQLQHYEFLEEKNIQFMRVHRSLILNLKRIKKVGDKEITFYGLDKSLKTSRALENKVKKILLGKS